MRWAQYDDIDAPANAPRGPPKPTWRDPKVLFHMTILESPLGVALTFSALELLGVGGLGAIAAKRFGFNYGLLTPLALLIKGAAGYFGSRTGVPGAAFGALVGLLDASAWATFGGVGPQPRNPALSWSARARIVATVTALGALCGWLGELLA